ncbi:hypothetical protein FRB98_002069 [Tulasnella sp. 332]|nr:hypothetical protein FRB98_002069 [Tulasnella sp. 332]
MEKATPAGRYLLGGAQISVQILQSLQSLIPVPFVQVAIGAASQVIQIAQAVQSNVEGVSVLTDRVNAVILVVITPLRGKRETDISRDLKASIERLSKDLLAIGSDVQRVKKRVDISRISSIIKAAVRYGDNAGLIASCTSRLDWAMQVFEVESHIQNSLRIAQMADKLEHVQADVQDIKAIVHDLAGRAVMCDSSLPSTAIPPKPAIFYGRESDVEDIVHRILSCAAARYALLGPGGIGKTSVAAAIMQHPDVVICFDSRRYWASCEQASSLESLYTILAKAFQIQDGSSDRMKAILSFLRTDTRQHIIVLDNFETPWDIEGRQSDVLDALCALFAVPNLAILVTMRGSLPGIHRIMWTQPPLPPVRALSLESATVLFIQIYPEASHDQALDALLAALDYVPLAVTLMAKAGSEGETPTELLARWMLEGTDVIHDAGGDRRTSVNMSIELSLRSNLLKNNPDALRLLSVLAILPGGVRSEIIPNLVPTIYHVSKARAVLLKASLIHTGSAVCVLHVLSPISSYVARYHPLSQELWESVRDFYIKYVFDCPLNINDPRFSKHIRALTLESINLETVLLRALRDDPSHATIEAAHLFSYSLYWTSPRSNVVTAAVEASKVTNSDYWQSRCLRLLSGIKRRQSKYDEALQYLLDARRVALQAGDRKLAARCLKSLGDLDRDRSRYDCARKAYEEAGLEHTGLGDQAQAVRCQASIACLDTNQGRFHKARATLQEVMVKREQLGDSYGAVFCRQWLAYIDSSQGYYDAARTATLAVRQEYEGFADKSGVMSCLRDLSWIDLGQERFEDSRCIAEAARQEYDCMGRSSGVAWCLRDLAIADIGQGRHEDARVRLEEAQTELELLGDQGGIASCTYYLAVVHQNQGRLADARSALQQARGQFGQLGVAHKAAECLQSLGDIYCMEAK